MSINQMLLATMSNSNRVGDTAGITTLFSGVIGCWYELSDFSKLWQDTAGTIAVTGVGQTVKRIDDKSGNGNTLTSTNGAVLELDGGGRYRLNMTGTSTAFSTSSINFTSVDKISMYSGARNASTSGASMLAELSVNAFNSLSAFYLSAGTDVGRGWSAQGNGTTSGAATTAKANSGQPDFVVLSITHDIAGSLSTMRRNGVAAISGTGSKGTGTFGNYPLYVGSRAGSSYGFVGKFYSLLIFGALHTAAQIKQVETYVNIKTGAF